MMGFDNFIMSMLVVIIILLCIQLLLLHNQVKNNVQNVKLIYYNDNTILVVFEKSTLIIEDYDTFYNFQYYNRILSEEEVDSIFDFEEFEKFEISGD